MARKEKQAEEEAEQENNATALEEPEPYSDVDADADGDSGGKKENENETETEQKPEPEGDSAHAGQKRKDPPTNTSKSEAADTKAPRRQGTRTSPRNNTENNPASAEQLLKFLLSPSAMPYCFPEDELEDVAKKSKEKEYKSYSLTSPSDFTPFEHLLCTHMLSKPLSHTLGMRSIRTLLNPPFNLTTPERIVSAGQKRVWEALEAARTQHRQKTASYIFRTAELYAKSETMFKLAEEANDDGFHGVIEHIKSTVPGLAVTGGEIFCRRVQCVDGWGHALWPFADSKAMDAVRRIGVPVDDAEALRNLLVNELDWDQIRGHMGLQQSRLDEAPAELVTDQKEARVQVAFVLALERALGCVLEGKVAELRTAAAGV
ncbi:uncharacterized protein Z520_02506 [Fonsecaea multimorphosa CBS 102226]|uniref:Uncharacterized protein n=1 Tax=Fonsecaea multimorphosa CBS 102226 TaxID=1442371 RepID=A0A0D2K8G8_9EURO|nr:uncharacterized protein Z520_02506 [Fonsecaea multimorphosa CBS 102226]KIY02368.1 hypothetical protein Z520_02506 [Fonsecaea multimorphosa CBS 102226]OAL29011.1 hypothetical protein AYO22_02447 [Fonsecaea multimorphosa]